MLVFFLINSYNINSNPVVPQELSRFVFKYYNTLNIDDFSQSLIDQINYYNPNLDTSFVNNYILNNDISPGELVRLIENKNLLYTGNIVYQNIYDLSQLSKKDWLEIQLRSEIYLVYTSESGRNVESSFGHISLLYKNKDINQNKYFFQNVAFLADNFIDEFTGRPTVINYCRGAFSSLSGDFVIYPFHDSIYQNMIIEGRTISLYKINLTDYEKIEIGQNIWKQRSVNKFYNFFIRNCLTEIIKILPGIDELIKVYSFRTPSEIVRILENKRYIEYVGTYISEKHENVYDISFNENRNYNRAKTAFNKSINTYFVNDVSGINYGGINFNLFHHARPYEGIVNERANLKIISFDAWFNKETVRIQQFTPVSLSFNPLLIDYLGLKYDYRLEFKEEWLNKMNIGFYFLTYNYLKLEVFYNHIMNEEVEKKINLSLIYSNWFIDIILNLNTNVFDTNDIIFDLKTSIYLRQNLAFNLQKEGEEFRVGMTWLF